MGRAAVLERAGIGDAAALTAMARRFGKETFP